MTRALFFVTYSIGLALTVWVFTTPGYQGTQAAIAGLLTVPSLMCFIATSSRDGGGRRRG